MPTYRLYWLNGTGSIHLAEWLEAESDAEAISKAGEITPGARKRELWLKDRLVARVDNQMSLRRT